MKVIIASRGEEIRVDDEDFERVSERRWYVGYADRNGPVPINVMCTSVAGLVLARFIMNAPAGLEVDHRDGNVLNAQKGNLRLCTHAQNMRNKRMQKDNRSGFKGVWFDSYSAKRGCPSVWAADIKANGKKRTIGRFRTPELAHAAYCAAAIELHGDFARFK